LLQGKASWPQAVGHRISARPGAPIKVLRQQPTASGNTKDTGGAPAPFLP